MSPLSRRRLEWLVRARGTDLAGWPEAERSAALALLRQSPDAQRVFADALMAEDAPEADCAVLARMQETLRRSLAPLPMLRRGLRASALAACVAGGVYLATSQADQLNGTAEQDTAVDPFTSAQTISLAALDQ